jgi:hypothetical protein
LSYYYAPLLYIIWGMAYTTFANSVDSRKASY